MSTSHTVDLQSGCELLRSLHRPGEPASLAARMPGTESSTTLAAAHDTGLPPNVPPRPPGSTASMISAGPVTPADLTR